MVVVLIVFCLRLPDEGGPSGASGLRPADLGFGAVDAQCDVFGLGVGEHVGQGAQAQAWSLRDGEPAFGQQRPDLADRPADRGGPGLIDHAEGLVGQTGAQVDQGDQQSVGEHQLLFWPSAGLAPPVAAAPLAAPGLASRLPPRREFGDKLAKVSP